MANKTARVRASIKDSVESTEIFHAWERKKRTWNKRGPNNRPLNGARVGQYHLKDDTSIRTISRRVSMEIGLDKQAERKERLRKLPRFNQGSDGLSFFVPGHEYGFTKAEVRDVLEGRGAKVSYSGKRKMFYVILETGEQGWFKGFFAGKIKLVD